MTNMCLYAVTVVPVGGSWVHQLNIVKRTEWSKLHIPEGRAKIDLQDLRQANDTEDFVKLRDLEDLFRSGKKTV